MTARVNARTVECSTRFPTCHSRWGAGAEVGTRKLEVFKRKVKYGPLELDYRPKGTDLNILNLGGNCISNTTVFAADHAN